MDALNEKRIVIAGGSGLIGSALASQLVQRGALVAIVSRQAFPAPCFPSPIRHYPWNALQELLEGALAVVNLAGDNIAAEPWTWARKKLLRDSRVQRTRSIAEMLGKVQDKPQVLVNASAVGFYGGRSKDLLNEDALPGEGFLSELCQKWESTADEAAMHDIRVVKLRTGIVLSRDGGVLPKLAKIVRCGAGCKLGNGKQGFSWIHITDLARLIEEVIVNPAYEGPLNATAPRPVSHLEFMKHLAQQLKRPLWPVPGFLTRLAIQQRLGEMGQALLLEGAYVEPKKALDLGFCFNYPSLPGALRSLLD